ncbi:MAG: ferritin-like domain-containing protein [Pirellulales bacterium]|nr:ferritin-like domain-containing protein [Pirellulales bacterium]
MIFFAEIDPVWMFLAGCALLTFILLKRSYRHFGKRHKSNSGPIEYVRRPTSKWDGAQRDALAQIERQKVEMHEMSRDLNGQLNSRIIILEKLVGQSQQQIERLEQLLEQNESVR